MSRLATPSFDARHPRLASALLFAITLGIGLVVTYLGDGYLSVFWRIAKCNWKPPADNAAMVECHKVIPSFYRTGGLFLDVDPKLSDALRTADVVITGHSRTVETFVTRPSDNLMDVYFRNKGLTFFVLAEEGSGFRYRRLVVDKLGVRPKIALINTDDVIADILQDWNREVIFNQDRFKWPFKVVHFAIGLQNYICRPDLAPTGNSCTLDGVTVPHGASRLFYSSRKVRPNLSCDYVLQRRTCNDGTLDGLDTFNNSECARAQPGFCVLGDTALADGESAMFYSVGAVNPGSTCDAHAHMRTCRKGELSGPAVYRYPSCTLVSAQPAPQPQAARKEAAWSPLAMLRSAYCQGPLRTGWRNLETGVYMLLHGRVPRDRQPVVAKPDLQLNYLDMYWRRTQTMLRSSAWQSACIIFYQIPGPHGDGQELGRVIAERTGRPYVFPDIGPEKGYYVYDGSHMDEDSSERWTKEFLRLLDPHINECLARGGNS
jgi:hypothetical protein